MPGPRFTTQTLKFLQGLKRHNNREWFQANRKDYETYVRGPMLQVVEKMAADLSIFAPDLEANPKKSIYRIYRDTRFSADKTPYKTQVAAFFPQRQIPKHQGAGLYLHVAADHVLIGGGVYGPESSQLYKIRNHISRHWKSFVSIVESPIFRRNFGEITGSRLKRVPAGFAPNDPAADYLKFRQFLIGTKRPAEFATRPRFYASVLRLFEQLAPFVRFLNEPINKTRNKKPDLLSVS